MRTLIGVKKASYCLILLALLGSAGCGVTGASGVGDTGDAGFLPPSPPLEAPNLSLPPTVELSASGLGAAPSLSSTAALKAQLTGEGGLQAGIHECNACEAAVLSCVSQMQFKLGDTVVDQSVECGGAKLECHAVFGPDSFDWDGDGNAELCPTMAVAEKPSCLTLSCSQGGEEVLLLKAVIQAWPTEESAGKGRFRVMTVGPLAGDCVSDTAYDHLISSVEIWTDTQQVNGEGYNDQCHVWVGWDSASDSPCGASAWVNGETAQASSDQGCADDVPPTPPDTDWLMRIFGIECAIDSDLDGTGDCEDLCPDDPAKSEPGVCGCETSDADTDGDGTADCNDQCPNDPNKTEPGTCGCGVSDDDIDADDCFSLSDGYECLVLEASQSSISARNQLDLLIGLDAAVTDESDNCRSKCNALESNTKFDFDATHQCFVDFCAAVYYQIDSGLVCAANVSP